MEGLVFDRFGHDPFDKEAGPYTYIERRQVIHDLPALFRLYGDKF
jgi:hypothetical protein